MFAEFGAMQEGTDKNGHEQTLSSCIGGSVHGWAAMCRDDAPARCAFEVCPGFPPWGVGDCAVWPARV